MNYIKTEWCKQDFAKIYKHKLLVACINVNVNHDNEQSAAAKYEEVKFVIYL